MDCIRVLHNPPTFGALLELFCQSIFGKDWSGRVDSNHRPPGPEPDSNILLKFREMCNFPTH